MERLAVFVTLTLIAGQVGARAADRPKVIVTRIADPPGPPIVLKCPKSTTGQAHRWYRGSRSNGVRTVARARRNLVVIARSDADLGSYACATTPPRRQRDAWDYEIVANRNGMGTKTFGTSSSLTACGSIDGNERSRRSATCSLIPSRVHYHYESVSIPVGERTTLTCGETGYSLAARLEGGYEWYWVQANGTTRNLSNENRTISVEGKRNGTTGHYECHYGNATFVDRFYIMVRGQESQDVEMDCVTIQGSEASWFYATSNNASDWDNYEYIGYLKGEESRECEKKSTTPCYSADTTQLRLPMCACAERPATETFICGLKLVEAGTKFDRTCWRTMITVKHRYIEDPTTPPAPTTSGSTWTQLITTTKTPPPPSTTSNPTTTTMPTNSSITAGLVVGIAIAAVILVVALVALCFSRRRRLSVWIRRRKPTSATSGDDLTANDVYRRNVSMGQVLSATAAAESRRARIVVEGVKIDASCEIAKGNVTLMRALGEGCFGLVMEGIATNVKGVTGSMQVAVKVPKAKDRKSVQDLASEVTVWQRIGEHKNVISLVGVTTFQNPAGIMLWVLMEYADHGCLSDYMRAKRFGSKNPDVDVTNYVPPDEQNVLSSRDMFRYALNVARGMEHLTMRECIHRDLAARNVLVCDGEVLKISDFGMAKDIHYFDYYRKRTPKNLVPYKWTAPEALLHRIFTEASDVWSFGVLLWEIATLGSAPYPGVPAENLYDLLTKDGYRMRKPRTCSRKFYDLMLKCWALDPIERPKFYELVTVLEKALAQAENWEEANVSGDETGSLDVSIPPTKRLLSAQDSGMPGTPTTPGSYSCFESRRDERAESTSL